MRRWRTTGRWLLVVAVLAFAALLAAEAWRRHALYWYDVRQDYAYDFEAASAASAPVELSTAEFELPPPATGSGTALLELRVEATVAGWWFEPCLDIAVGDQRRRPNPPSSWREKVSNS